MVCRLGVEPEAEATRAPSVVVVGRSSLGSDFDSMGGWMLVVDALLLVVVVHGMGCIPSIRRCRTSLGGDWRMAGPAAVARQGRR